MKEQSERRKRKSMSCFNRWIAPNKLSFFKIEVKLIIDRKLLSSIRFQDFTSLMALIVYLLCPSVLHDCVSGIDNMGLGRQ